MSVLCPGGSQILRTASPNTVRIGAASRGVFLLLSSSEPAYTSLPSAASKLGLLELVRSLLIDATLQTLTTTCLLTGTLTSSPPVYSALSCPFLQSAPWALSFHELGLLVSAGVQLPGFQFQLLPLTLVTALRQLRG